MAGAWRVLLPAAFHVRRSARTVLGTLEDVDGCIRATAEYGSFAVVWPPGYWLSIDDNEPVVHGFTRDAGMGEPVRMGGGYREDGQPPPGSRDIGGCAPPFFLTTGFGD